jgi:type I restriction enzyme M protein
MNERVDGLLSFAERAIFSDVAVKLEPTCGDMVTDGPDDLAVTVINRGSLPLREVHVTGALGRAADEVIHYLAERGRASITFKNFIDPAFSGRCEVDLQWTALTLQGKDVRGTERLVFEVVQPGPSATEQADLGSSPYICASPVDPQRDDVFFGREQELGQIRRQVATSANVVLLEGNRRAGKTSILKHLEGRDAVPGWLGVYCSLQDAPGSEEGAGVPTVEVFRLMARELAKAVHRLGLDTPLPDGTELAASRKPLGVAKACRAGIGTDGPFSDLAEYLDLLLALLAPLGLGILLLLDEFDKLQEGIDSGVTSPQVPENIRFLVQNHPRFSAVLTGSRRLKRLREEYWSALFGLGTRIGVSALPQAAARRLVTEPVQGRLKYSDAAVDRAIELTGAQPFLLQNLCNRIFDLVAREIPGVESSSALRSRSVTPEVVERAAVELVQDNEHFAALWGYAGSHRRRFILALCRREQEARGPIRLGELGELLAVEGVPTPDEALDADLDHLRELELLELTGRGEYGRYRLAVPLMGLWVGNQQDFDSLRVKARFETEDEHG